MIVAVVSKKGGVGKTTTTVCLAAALADRGHRVLLADLDSQASASVSFGVGRAALAPSLADVLLWDAPVREALRRTRVPNLDLLTASADLAGADLELGSYRQRESRLRGVLDPVAGDYDYVLLDCPPGLSLLSLNALAAADVFVTPVAPHFLAIHALSSLLAAAERVRAHHNRDLSLAGILLTLVDYRSRDTRRNVDAIRAEYGGHVFGVEVRVNVRLAEAPAAAQTIFEYAPTAAGATAYRLVAEELLLRIDRLARRRAAPLLAGGAG
ncbi:MAG TPA: ParA family protein [Thermoanaerobaculia bacterium]|nr:ParA family protein [Thermoanaerobaculia bacterium]